MRGEIIHEYRKLNSEDHKAFRRWLWANMVVGAILVAGLIALTSKFTGDGAVSLAQTPGSNHPSTPHAD
jgi:hypothetical protein